MQGKDFVSRQVGAGKALRGRKAKEDEKRGKLPGAEGWLNTKTLAGKGCGYKPPTAALRKIPVGGV